MEQEEDQRAFANSMASYVAANPGQSEGGKAKRAAEAIGQEAAKHARTGSKAPAPARRPSSKCGAAFRSWTLPAQPAFF